jgi:hypothetical protein
MVDWKFEGQVLVLIDPILRDPDTAEFQAGTLFLSSSEATARSVFHKLSSEFGVDKVQIFKLGAEFAFDFVA